MLSEAVLLAVSLGGCGARTVPAALSLPQEDQPDSVEVHDRASALAATLQGDPLARRPRFPPPSVLDALGDATALRMLATETMKLERAQADVPEGLRALSTRWAGTEVVALSLGYRLGLAERLVGAHAHQLESSELHALGSWLTPIRPAPEGIVFQQSSLGVLADDPSRVPEAALQAGERAVLRAWLVGPTIPLEPVADALRDPAWRRLSTTRLGRLLLSRADADADADADVAPSKALDDLRLATELALIRAAADRASEQGRWSDRRRDASTRLDMDAPIAGLLKRSVDALIPAAGDAHATGAALLALEALRFEDACDLPPCRGLFDRTLNLSSTMAWSDDLRPLIAAWQAVALKQALDSLEVGRDTVRYRFALADTVDAILGTGGSAVRADVLADRVASPRVWAGLSAAVGERGGATWEDARVALGQHLADIAHRAHDEAPEPWREPLSRIAARAIP